MAAMLCAALRTWVAGKSGQQDERQRLPEMQSQTRLRAEPRRQAPRYCRRVGSREERDRADRRHLRKRAESMVEMLRPRLRT